MTFVQRILAVALMSTVLSCIDTGGDSDGWTLTPDEGADLPPVDGTVAAEGGPHDTLLGDLGAPDLQSTDLTSGPNSGQTCDQNTPCPPGDSCFMLAGWSRGMCFGTCTSQGDLCGTPDPAKYLSQCAVSGRTGTQWYCLYLCEFKGLSYDCPDPATQECVVSTSAGGSKVCKPK